jgi:glutamate-1-semialdehyde 2,1-aminomutase
MNTLMMKPESSTLADAYVQALPTSQALYHRARKIFPDGVTHDDRRMQPFPIFVDRAEGARKWDVDGRAYVDYWMGHGSLFLGHNPPPIRDAIIQQAARGTHYGASHPLEVRWAELICQLVPCAELVRFTASGTESAYLAVRLARAFTGRDRVVKFAGHFHGWYEGMKVGYQAPYDVVPESGQLRSAVEAVALCPPNDIAAVRQALSAGDVAAVILEPTGGRFGVVPMLSGFLEQVRDATRRAGALLIFDEVVSGFRVGPGGAQELSGVIPDLATFAKILGGGLPGGAVAGRAEIFAHLATRDAPDQAQRGKILHHGTFNANPLTAAAGVAMLGCIADGAATRTANAQAVKLRHGLNEILARAEVPWKVYGQHSDCKFFYGADAPPRDGDDQSVDHVPWQRLNAKQPQTQAMRQAMILNGIDFSGARALVGTCHTDDVIAETLEAFGKAVRLMKQSGAT